MYHCTLILRSHIGSAAVQFALIVRITLLVYVGGIEVSQRDRSGSQPRRHSLICQETWWPWHLRRAVARTMSQTGSAHRASPVSPRQAQTFVIFLLSAWLRIRHEPELSKRCRWLVRGVPFAARYRRGAGHLEGRKADSCRGMSVADEFGVESGSFTLRHCIAANERKLRNALTLAAGCGLMSVWRGSVVEILDVTKFSR